MALLARQVIALTGLTPTFVAASAGGDTLAPGDDVHLHIKTGATGTTVTIDSVRSCDLGFDHDLVVVIGTNSERKIGPLPANRFAQPTTGLVNITYTSVATVTVAAIVA